MLRARLPLLNEPLEALVAANRPVSDPGWRWSNVPLGLKAKAGEGQEKEKPASPGAAHALVLIETYEIDVAGRKREKMIR